MKTTDLLDLIDQAVQDTEGGLLIDLNNQAAHDACPDMECKN